jgi:hypothetical protein
MHYTIQLTDSCCIEGYSGKGVYRIRSGDTIQFRTKATQKIFILDIVNECVAELVADTVVGVSAFGMTQVWSATHPGPYQLSLQKISNDLDKYCCPSQTIVVEPNLAFNVAHSSQLRLLTVMPRRLGYLHGWAEVLRDHVFEQGYNGVHLTPFQPAGPSGSSYSIADVLDVDGALFPLTDSVRHGRREARVVRFSEAIESIKRTTPLFMVTDVVLNHASSGDSWVLEMPEATYCLANCPYLRGAFELDQLMADFEFKGSIRSESDLAECMHAFRTSVEKFHMKEFFALDFANSVEIWGNHKRSNNKPQSVCPWDQAVAQIGRSRGETIVIDCSGCCPDESSLWKELNLVSEKLKNLSNECFLDLLSACESTLRYERLELGRSSGPLFPRYFSPLSNGDWALNNGWVMNWPAGVDFAAPGPHIVFLKRHVVVWGDCIKLRYNGESAVWSVMESYCCQIASQFDGIRLDNCHSTPIHVLRRLLGLMRKVNPQLVVMAELFTGAANNVYEATLGIDLLVREGMQVWGVDSLVEKLWEVANVSVGSCSEPEGVLEPTVASALMYDATHDNQTVQLKFGSFTDALPLAAAVAFCPSAIGSSAGFDRLAVRMPSVVQPVCRYVQGDDFDHCPVGNRSVPEIWMSGHAGEEAVEVFGEWDSWERGVRLEWDRVGQFWRLSDATKILGLNNKIHFSFKFFLVSSRSWVVNPQIGVSGEGPLRNNIIGRPGCFWAVKRELLKLHASLDPHFFCVYRGNNVIEIRRGAYSQVTVLIRFDWGNSATSPLHVNLDANFSHIETAISLEKYDDDFGGILSHHSGIIRHWSKSELGFRLVGPREIAFDRLLPSVVIIRCSASPKPLPPPHLDELSLPIDFARILFRCDPEESTYEVPGMGKLIFAGIAGVAYAIEDLRAGFLGSSLAANIRDGDWLFDYLVWQIEKVGCVKMARWLREKIRSEYVQLSPGLKPSKFVEIFSDLVFKRIVVKWESMFLVGPMSSLEKWLRLAALQFTASPTMAAGLPHFASGYMRCWGRDTFISLPGLLLPDRYEDAKNILIDFASVVRHGLIPNLFDDGQNPRYNSRDACWCYLRSLVEYLKIDKQFMDHSVQLKFPAAAFPGQPPVSGPISIKEIVFGILRAHYDGIRFTEWNAGPQIDEFMTPAGFDIEIYVEKSTGLIYGGNEWNCGTWMDKMGSGWINRGKPATPRYGANVEINGLALYVLENLVGEYWPNEVWLVDWLDRMKVAFDTYFFDPVRAIFKDVVGGDLLKGNQLRPNACFALAVVPIECIPRHHAVAYLAKCEESLLGPLGMRTLCASDPEYNGNYDNSDESRGYNYHNGPEWGWLLGYYIIACARFDVFPKFELVEILQQHETHIANSPYRSLPELTNMNGAFCQFSCPSQAWSVATILEAIQHLK